jgi:tRNA (Thr-GGU) A37 N-methylase
VVRLVKVDGCTLHVEDLDILDGTPLLDIKPFVEDFDVRRNTRRGWLESRIERLHSTRDDSRFVPEDNKVPEE